MKGYPNSLGAGRDRELKESLMYALQGRGPVAWVSRKRVECLVFSQSPAKNGSETDNEIKMLD